VRVVTWNVAGRIRALPEQAAALAGLGADIVCLQEVTSRTEPLWRAALAESGLAFCESAVASLPPAPARRRLAVLTAARSRLARRDAPEMPWPERLLICAVAGIEVINLHSPIAPAPDLAKIRTHEALAAFLGPLAPAPRVLCGDLNTPRREFADGDILTFAHDTKGNLRPERGERWNRAERALVRDLGWTDAFRALHGYEHREASWTFAHDRGGWRLDHVLLAQLQPVAAAYAHDWRRAGLSDHSPLVVDFTP
jgi:exonuclease III